MKIAIYINFVFSLTFCKIFDNSKNKIHKYLFLQFIIFCATLAIARAGVISSVPAVATYQATPEHHSYTKTVAYSAPKSYIQPAAVATYHYPEQQQAIAYHHEPSHAVIHTPHYEHGHSEQNIVRSAHGTVSQTSKVVQTPTSSVRKSDTRITNDGYKTVAYAQPSYYHAQPEHHLIQASPVIAKTFVSEPHYAHQPSHHIVSEPHYAHQPSHHIVSSPVTYAHQAPVAYAHQAPVAYAHQTPVVAKIHYSPAVETSHVSFESPIAHYAW